MKQYFGNLNGRNFTITPTPNRTEKNEVKCQVSWENDGTDFIWFDDLGDKLVCQLNPNIFVMKSTAKKNSQLEYYRSLSAKELMDLF
jgi:hypothetical protein